jgi:hypothetical protein
MFREGAVSSRQRPPATDLLVNGSAMMIEATRTTAPRLGRTYTHSRISIGRLLCFWACLAGCPGRTQRNTHNTQRQQHRPRRTSAMDTPRHDGGRHNTRGLPPTLLGKSSESMHRCRPSALVESFSLPVESRCWSLGDQSNHHAMYDALLARTRPAGAFRLLQAHGPRPQVF